jgi:predicted naringenin-chalcone synthase
MKAELYLHSFQSVLPTHRVSQDDLLKWVLGSHLRSCEVMGDTMEMDRLERFLPRFAVGSRYISQRYFECEDLNDQWEMHGIYHISNETPFGATIGARNRLFVSKTQRVFTELYPDRIPKHIVHVTCTGYSSPDPVQSYFSKKNYAPAVTHAYHMGCYASLPSIRMAMGLSSLQNTEIDVVHNEMCGLHMDPSNHTPEQIVVQTLFADGHIKYCVGHEERGFRILTITEKMIPDTLNEMTWIPDAFGMKMTLSRDVPKLIRLHIRKFLSELCDGARVNEEEVLKSGVFAIHPGGPRIIEGVQEELKLTEDQVKHGKEVLFERGNMSSATLPHIWERILASKYPRGTKIVSLAFGPGLTIFGAVYVVEG